MKLVKENQCTDSFVVEMGTTKENLYIEWPYSLV